MTDRRHAAFLVPVLLAAALGGCTTYQVSQGRDLIAEGRVDEGLAELERIARENPGNAEARGAFVTQRSVIVNQLVADGDNARLWGNLDDAERAYRRALEILPSEPTARNGLEAVAKARRHAKHVAEGEMLLKAGNRAGAEAKARAVLAEDSGHRGARSLMRAVTEQQAAAELARPELKAALAKPITLEFRDAPLRSVFEVISRTSGINFVFDRDVRPDLKATIYVRNTNLDDVIKLLLLTNQLERKVVNENSVLVYPNTQAKQKEYQELVVRSFYLANADAKQTAQLVRALVKTRDIFIDEKLNLLVIKDTPEAVRLAEKLIATQDLGEPEVLLEVEVLEVQSNKLNQLGLDPANSLSYGVGLSAGTGFGGAPALVPLTGGGFRWYTPNPAVVAQLRGTDSAANVLANPRIRVKNRDKARIHIGEKVPVITTTSTANVGVSASVSYLDTGLKLDVEPNIYLEDEVAIKVQLEVSNILEQLNISGTVAYRLGTRNTATTLRLKDGETQMLAGLISDADRRTTEGLPYLANVPILRRLFATTDEKVKSEIVLLITPRIVRNVLRPETVAAQFHSGTESNIGASPLTLKPTLPSTVALASSGGAAAPVPRSAPRLVPGAPRQAGVGDGAPAVPLLFAAPSQANAGGELTVSLGVPSGNDLRSAEVELAYDPRVLQPLGGASGDDGRLLVEVPGPGVMGATAPPVEVRFRVLATAPTATQISVSARTGVAASGAAVPVTVPGGQTVTIVGSQGGS